jgi:uncharacterized protein (DUF488 family)
VKSITSTNEADKKKANFLYKLLYSYSTLVPFRDLTRRGILELFYTIGHSTRSLDELIAALAGQGITTLADVRAFPMSRRLPHFNRESLESELPKQGISYVWMKELGGRRKKILQDSPNLGLRNDSFRNYADYMMTAEFAQEIERLLQLASLGKTAYMCAERVYFQCHRMLISDYLTAHRHTVLHIDDEKRAPREHRLMPEARLVKGKLVYDGGVLL